MYEEETILTHISFPVYQVHTVDSMLFCVDTDASHSCIGDKTLERIVCHSGRVSIPVIDYKHDFKHGDTLVRSRGMVKLMLPTLRSTIEIPFILDVVEIEIPTLLGLDVLDRNNLLVHNMTNHLWNRIITNKDPLRFDNMLKIKLIRNGQHLYVPLSTSIQLFYTLA